MKFKNESLLNKIYIVAICTLVFLAGLNLHMLGNYFILILGCISFIKILITRKLRISNLLIILLFFSIFSLIALLFFDEFYLTNFFVFSVSPLCCYFVANDLIDFPKSQKEKFVISNKLKVFLFFYLAGTFLNASLTLITTILDNGIRENHDRTITNIWIYFSNKPSYSTGTTFSFSILPFAFLIIPFLAKKTTSFKKILFILIGLVTLCFSIFTMLYIQNRGFLLATIFALFGLCAFTICSSENKYIIGFSAALFSLVPVFFLCLFMNVFGLKTYLLKYSFISRLVEFGNDSRFGLYNAFFKNFYKFPLGGLSNYLGKIYIHNIFFDCCSNLGNVCGLLFILLFVILFVDCFYLMMSSENKARNLFYTISLFSFVGLGMIEPLWNGNSTIFAYFLIIFFCLYFTKQYETSIFKRTKKINLENPKVVLVNHFLTNHINGFHESLKEQYGLNYTCLLVGKIDNDHILYHKEIVDEHCVSVDLKNKSEFKKAKQIIKNADIVIYSNCPRKLLFSVYKRKHLIFQLSERPYVKSLYEVYGLSGLFNALIYNVFFERYKPICLETSAYTADDYAITMHCLRRCLCWTYYFKSDVKEVTKPNEKLKLLYVNRFVEWKHIEHALNLAIDLKNTGTDFVLNIVGFGTKEQEQNILTMINENNLGDCVNMLGKMNNDDVHKLMTNSDIVLSTSDRTERCGCCVNEALAYGACPVASHLTGSAPLLINNGENGFIFEFGNRNQLFRIVKFLAENKDQLYEIKKACLKSYYEKFSNEVSFNNFLHQIDYLRNNNCLDLNLIDTTCELTNKVNEYDVLKKVVVENNDDNSNLDKDNKAVSVKNGIRKQYIQAIISYLSVIITIGIGFFYTPWIVNALGPSNYSIYSLAGSIIGIVSVDLGIDIAVNKFISKYRFDNDKKGANELIGTVQKFLLVVGSIIAIVLLILFFFLENIFIGLTSTELESLKIVYIIVSIYSITSFETTSLNGILSANDQFFVVKVVNLLVKILDVILVIIAIKSKGGLYLFTLITVVTNLIGILIKYIIVKKKCEYGTKIVFSKESVKHQFASIYKYIFWIAISGIASRFVITIQSSILGITSNSSQIAIFALAASIESYVYTLSAAINGLFMPDISLMEKNNATSDDYLKKMISVGRFQLICICLVFYAWISFGKGFICNIWKVNSEDFSYELSYFVSLFLLIPCVINNSKYLSYLVLLAKGKEKYYTFSIIVTAIISVGLSFLLTGVIKNNGALYAGLAVFIGNIVGLIILYSIFIKKTTGINICKFYFETLVKLGLPLGVSAILGLVIDNFLPSSNFVIFAFKVFVFAIIYLIITVILLNKKERKMVTSYLDKIAIKGMKFENE